MRRLICVLLFSLFTYDGFAQGRVTVETPNDDRELKFAARRLRVPPENLKKARALLPETLQLARTLEHLAPQGLSSLAYAIVRIEPAKAPTLLHELYTSLLQHAVMPSTPQEYWEATSSVSMVLNAMAELDPEGALQRLEQWPSPPPGTVPGPPNRAFNREQWLASQKANLVSQLARRNPERALSMAGTADPQTINLMARGNLARELAEAGQRDRGLQLIRESIGSFRQAPQMDDRQVQEFMNMMGQTGHFFPEAVKEAASAFAQRLQDPRSVALTRRTQLQTDRGQIELDPNESVALDFARRMSNRPEALTEFLAQFPALRAKLDGLGGLDAVLSARYSSHSHSPTGSRMVLSMQGPLGSGRMMPDGTVLHMESGAEVASEIRKNLTTNRSAVRSRLNELASQGKFDVLIRLAHDFANQNEYEFSIYALDLARSVLPQLGNLEQRQRSMLMLIQTHQSVEGEVPRSLIDEAFALGKQLEAEQQKAPAAAPVPTAPVPNAYRMGTFSTDHYYSQLYGYAFRGDPDGTIKRIRALPDDQRKLMILSSVIQTFMRPDY